MLHRVIGTLLVIGGIVQMLYAGGMDVTLPSEPGIANNDLMQIRLLIFLGGVAAFLAGVIDLGVERLRGAIIQARPVGE